MGNITTTAESQGASVRAFIACRESSGAVERANCRLFLSELCEQLDVAYPDHATSDTFQNARIFERAVTSHHSVRTLIRKVC